MRAISFRFLVLWAGLVCSGPSATAWAQSEGAVRGQVVAAADGSALPGASVTLTAASTGVTLRATSDAAGRFVFTPVTAGQYLISASFEGFAPRELRLSIEPREIGAVTLALDVGRLDVDVKVAASATDLLVSTHSPSSTVLTDDRVDAMPPFERMNLTDAIVTSAPGMIRGHDDFVHIRGHEIALNPLIDGVSFWENAHSVFSAGLSPEIVETANVMTGGFPAEYGNRFGGVVDIVTKSGLRLDHRGSVTLSLGDEGRRRAAGDVGGTARSLGYYVYGSMFHSDRFLSPPEPVALHDAATGGHMFASFDAQPNRIGSFRVVLMGDGINAEIPTAARDEALRPQANARQRTRQQTTVVSWNRARPDTLFAASAYERWSRLRLLAAAGPLTVQADLTRELLTLGGKFDVTRIQGRHAFKAGIDAVRLRPEEDLAYNYAGYRELAHLLELPHLHVSGQVIRFSGREAGGQVSAYVQDSVRFGARVTADIGVRVDRHDLVVSQTHASPRVNIAVQAAGGTVLHASYNHFFVPPPIEGILSSSAGLTRSIQEIGMALPALTATVENQFEAGATVPFRPVQLAVAGYYRATDNPVHTTVWPDSRIYSYASFDRARAYGLEAKADLTALRRYGVDGYLNYAVGRVYFFNPVTGGFVTEAAHLTDTSRFLAPMDQTHTVTAGVTYRNGSGFWAGTAVEYGSGTPIGHGGSHEHAEGEDDHTHAPGSSPDRVPGHVTGNMSLGVDVFGGTARRPRLTLRLDVENVANRPYVIAREGEFSPSQYSGLRLISATARIRF
jgi:hypothetical protein